MSVLKDYIKENDGNKTFEETLDDVMFAVQYYNERIKDIDPILFNTLKLHFLKSCGILRKNKELEENYKELQTHYNNLKKRSKGLIIAIESDMEMQIPGVSDLTTTYIERVKGELK